MAVKSNKGRGINQPLIIISGLLFLLGAVLIYVYILRGVYGGFSASELLPKSSVIENVVNGSKPTIAILYSKYTENMLPEGSTWLSDNINTWKKFLNAGGYKYDVISDQTIERGKHFKYKLIVLPGDKSLSDKEIVQLKEYIR